MSVLREAPFDRAYTRAGWVAPNAVQIPFGGTPQVSRHKNAKTTPCKVEWGLALQRITSCCAASGARDDPASRPNLISSRFSPCRRPPVATPGRRCVRSAPAQAGERRARSSRAMTGPRMPVTAARSKWLPHVQRPPYSSHRHSENCGSHGQISLFHNIDVDILIMKVDILMGN
jgi:hypothetical protein